jgi:predicted Zn-dependent protease
MTDDKKTSQDLGEIDWDEALAEWDKTSFVPEVAKDVVTDKPAALAGPTRPLYRPPTVSPAVKPKTQSQPPPELPQIPRWADDEDEDGATRVRHVPEELLRRGGAEIPVEEDLPPVRDPQSTKIELVPMDAEEELKVDDQMLAVAKAEAPPLPRPVLLAPESRRYDPNEVTEIVREGVRPPPVPKLDGAAPTVRPPGAPSPLPEPRTFLSERQAALWLSEAMREGLEARASWLEEEARELEDVTDRARALLGVSEICATLGERERAQSLAAAARDLAPRLSLAHQQARSLLPSSPPDDESYVDAVKAELKVTPAGPAHLHAILLLTDRLRAMLEDDAAAQWLEEAVLAAPSDVRAVVARAARGLANDKLADVPRDLPDAPEIAPLTEAIETCLRLRGMLDDEATSLVRSPIELLFLARRALDRGQPAEAAALVAGLVAVPELAQPARWLAASLAATQPARRSDALRWLQELAERGDEEARRVLLMRALERSDTQRLSESVGDGGPLTSAERVTIAALAGLPMSASDPHLDATAATPGMQPLAAALTSLAMPTDGDRSAQMQARARRTAGAPSTRALVALGRLLAALAPPREIDAALEALGDPRPGTTRAIALETANLGGRSSEVADTLEAWGAVWGSREDSALGPLAAALVSERGGNQTRALEAFKAARTAAPTNEAALRAIASLEQVDLVAEMNELADELGDGVRAAMARIEAAARGEGVLPEPTRAHMLERAHGAAPALPIASFLAERIARRAGEIDEVLRWVRERREASSDAVEAALDAVREALLVADREPLLAAERLQEAHRARSQDVALRQLFERMASESAEARALWREQHAAETAGDGRALLLLEAAREYEQSGDDAAALRCAQAAAVGNDGSLSAIACERAELRSRSVARLAEELLATAKGAEDPRTRREAYERLAVLDANVRQDPASALLWHRTILEEFPGHEPSLRHIEHHLITEGREEELEPIAAAVARSLRGTGAGEATAHAELSVRLRLRGADAKWDATREMVELAATESEPSLWALRMLQAHARSRGDDALLLSITPKLLDRPLRPPEKATLLVGAGEAAARLGRLEESVSLLARAIAEQPEDVVGWMLLADVRRRAGGGRAAAEAYEALARGSNVREHQLQAWYDAGQAWLDDPQEAHRAAAAFETAATMDITYKDVFERLSHVYASQKMVGDLANLLERRINLITDPDERLAMEVTRGRVLLEAGDAEGARRAFESALADHPEDARALSAYADLCVSQQDWEAAEQALVRLSRLLPTAEEQRGVYARLGELYAEHLSNLPRAEVAFKEVLKRAPDDVQTIGRLIEVYKRQHDAPHAAEFLQQLVSKSRTPEDKRARLLALATIHEETGNDKRRAEQTLETARREFPQDVSVLRALAEFYTRHRQTPAFNILLDRAGGDARRALAAGRISPATFEVLATVFDLRGKQDAARITKGMLAAIAGQPGEIGGAGHRAFDAKLDDLLAPDALTPAVRALLSRTGDALDRVATLDLRAMKAAPLSADAPLARLATGVGQAIGLGDVQVLVSPRVGATCVPAGASPAAIIVGETLPGERSLAAFLVLRALKLVHARASAVARGAPADLAVLVSAWLKCFNPSWQPQGINPALVNATAARIQSALPRSLPAEVASLALEASASVGAQPAALGTYVAAWADRVALLAMGDWNGALDGIAAASGSAGGAPREAKDRSAWLARTPGARDLLAFAVSDAFVDARAKVGLD